MANYIGNAPAQGEFKKLDSIASLFDGVTSLFALKFNGSSVQVGDANQLLVSVNGVVQEPLVSYTLGNGGSQIQFIAVPPIGSTCFITMFGAVGGVANTITDNSVTSAKLADSSVTTSKIANNAITSTKLASGSAVSNIGYTPVNKAGDSMSGVHRYNSYLSIGKGPANNDQITWNAIPDNAGNYTPQWTGDSTAGGVIMGMPSGGNGGLEIRTLKFGTNSSPQALSAYPVCWNMTDTGMITMPKQPAFFAVKQAGSVNASTGAGIVSFSNTMLDRSNSWNGSRFTAPVAGAYKFTFDHMYHHEGGDITFQIFKNGAAVAYNNPYGRDSQGYAEQWSSNSVSWLGTLAVGDYVECSWASGGNAATTLYGSGLYTRFMGHLIG